VSQSKPSAEPLQLLCQLAGQGSGMSSSSESCLVNPNQCIVVGDTTSDTGMAQNAGAGFCIGVLTGSGTADQLKATGAHLILPHVGHIPQLFLDHGSTILGGSSGVSSQSQMTPNNKTIYV
jgi:phosphoglycolate phosphatase-like HAD superfamily hydrolase